jgi:mono/diheme cytochrome c family protein
VPFDLLTTDQNIVAFGIDPSNGDVLLADIVESQIKRLVAAQVGVFPQTLADTGAFTNLATLTPQAGIVGCDINVPFWSDNAHKTRWFYIPTNRTHFPRRTTGPSRPAAFGSNISSWVDQRRAFVRNVSRPASSSGTTAGVTASLIAGTMPSPMPRWCPSGLDEAFVINDSGILRTQIWHYPSRGECLACHTASTFGGLALGFNTPQMNRDFDYGGVVDNQIRALGNAGYFTVPPTDLHSLRALAQATNESVSVEQRVRSYLTANCVYCHQPGGSGQGVFDTRIFTSLSNTRLVNGTVVNGGTATDRVIAPAEPLIRCS